MHLFRIWTMQKDFQAINCSFASRGICCGGRQHLPEVCAPAGEWHWGGRDDLEVWVLSTSMPSSQWLSHNPIKWQTLTSCSPASFALPFIGKLQVHIRHPAGELHNDLMMCLHSRLEIQKLCCASISQKSPSLQLSRNICSSPGLQRGEAGTEWKNRTPVLEALKQQVGKGHWCKRAQEPPMGEWHCTVWAGTGTYWTEQGHFK